MSRSIEDLPIVADRTCRLSGPGFGAVVADGGGSLRVPTVVAEVLDDHAIDSASAFVSYVRTYPSAIADDLEMDVEEVGRACGELAEELRGHVDEDLLIPGDPGDFGFGSTLPGG